MNHRSSQLSKIFGADLLLIICLSSAGSYAQDANTTAKGVNPSDNITKTELIYRFDNLDAADYTQSVTLKYDRAFDERWGANIEIPIVSFSGFGIDDTGLGDVQARLRYSTNIGKMTALLGGEIVLPTATEDTLGRGKYQFNPVVGAVATLSQTSFLFLGYKHFWSFAGDDARAEINESQPRAIVGYTSPKGWWLLGDLKYTKSWENENELLDIELEYGRMIGPSTGVWARVGTSALDSDREAMVLFGVRFIR